MDLIPDFLKLKKEPKKKANAIRYAVVGLGNFAQTAILPAFANATDTRLKLVEALHVTTALFKRWLWKKHQCRTPDIPVEVSFEV